jgi:hypothetical protein
MKFLFENLVKESRVLSEGRKEDARERYPNIPEGVFNVFVEEDPSGNHKYLMAISKMWEETNSRWGYQYRNTSDAKDFMENVTYFHNQTQKFEKKDINQYQSMQEFKDAVVEAKQNLSQGEIKKSAKKVFEDQRHLVVQPLTHAASCFYGAGTRWCTTSRNYPRHYLQYTSSGTLFYYINKRNGKKRAFYTPFSEPFLRPETVRGTSDQALGRTQVFTETDNRGRSLRGIPIGARQAMDDEHKKGLEKYIESLSMEKRIEYLINRGMDLPEGITEYNGNWNVGRVPPPQIKKINGNFRDSGLGFGSLVEVTGNVDFSHRNTVGFGDLEVIGGDLKVVGYYSWSRSSSTIESLGKLKRVNGTFKWNTFPNLDKEELGKLEHVGQIEASSSQVASLMGDIKLPGLPDTKVSV